MTPESPAPNGLAAARLFLLGHARLLERRMAEHLFDGASATPVIDCLRAYRNADGGFGNALEPDTRCPESLPISVETALRVMTSVGVVDPELVEGAVDFLAATARAADARGAVPLALPVIERYPRAEHMTEWTYVPALNPTAGFVGLLYELDVDHDWRAQATTYCWTELEQGEPPDTAHTLSEVLCFLEHVPDRDRAAVQVERIRAALPDVEMLRLDPAAAGYGLTPLQLAPVPSSPWRALFSDDLIDSHLDQLERDQQADGGWPIRWDPPSGAGRDEWRGAVTLEALRTLRAYGRLDHGTDALR